jgi:hypothetical protein
MVTKQLHTQTHPHCQHTTPTAMSRVPRIESESEIDEGDSEIEIGVCAREREGI